MAAVARRNAKVQIASRRASATRAMLKARSPVSLRRRDPARCCYTSTRRPRSNALTNWVRNKASDARRPEFVYRYDSRAPAEIAQHGMRPYNVNAQRPLMDHVRQNNYASQWTSTSRDSMIPGINNKLYVYKIRLPANGVDANTHFANHGETNPYAAQHEYAIPGVIQSQNVVGVMKVTNFLRADARGEAPNWVAPAAAPGDWGGG